MEEVSELADDLRALDGEARVVHRTLVLPNWGSGDLHGFTMTLYGYMMCCLARIDFWSYLWKPGGQTQRMVSFLAQYMAPGHEAARAAVMVWRHELMHNGTVRPVYDGQSHITYRWLLHWGSPHLPLSQHWLYSREGIDSGKLDLGLLYLLDDMRDALDRFEHDLDRSSARREHFAEAWKRWKAGRRNS